MYTNISGIFGQTIAVFSQADAEYHQILIFGDIRVDGSKITVFIISKVMAKIIKIIIPTKKLKKYIFATNSTSGTNASVLSAI